MMFIMVLFQWIMTFMQWLMDVTKATQGNWQITDVSDAFMSPAVEEKELPHTLAPNVESED
jgi:hypothetical protein